MSKRKRFGVSSEITEGIADVVNAVRNNRGSFRYSILPLAHIEPDPQNPRELSITINDLDSNLQLDDVDFPKKKRELEELKSLSATIQKKGVINPVVVYKVGSKYRLVAGERRYLASVMAKKTDIHVKILPEPPDTLDLRMLQWIENNERKDLSLKEKLYNLQAILDAYLAAETDVKVTGNVISSLTGLAKEQATCYLAILNADDELRDRICTQEINSIKKAAMIARAKDPECQKILLEACVNGASIPQLQRILSDEKAKRKKKALINDKQRPGRKLTRINLGSLKDGSIVEKLISIVLTHPDFQHHKSSFDKRNWTNFDDATDAFQDLIRIISTQ